MKRIIVISFLAALTVIAVSVALYAQAGRSPASAPVGSFQILSGRYAVGNIGANGSDLDTTESFESTRGRGRPACT
jgi:hypothetical protein